MPIQTCLFLAYNVFPIPIKSCISILLFESLCVFIIYVNVKVGLNVLNFFL